MKVFQRCRRTDYLSRIGRLAAIFGVFDETNVDIRRDLSVPNSNRRFISADVASDSTVHADSSSGLPTPPRKFEREKIIRFCFLKEDRLASLQSAPASLAGSEENLTDLATDDQQATPSTATVATDGLPDTETGGARGKGGRFFVLAGKFFKDAIFLGHRRTGSFDIELLKEIAERVNSGEPSKKRPPKVPPKPKKNFRLPLTNICAPLSTQNGELIKKAFSDLESNEFVLGQGHEDSPTSIPMAHMYLESHLQVRKCFIPALLNDLSRFSL